MFCSDGPRRAPLRVAWLSAAEFYRKTGELDPAWMAPSPTPRRVRARLAAATFLTALRVALHIWLDVPADTSLADLIARALAEAGRGFG